MRKIIVLALTALLLLSSVFACKKILNEKMNAILDPIREKRKFYEEHKDTVRDIILEGTKKANEIGNENIAKIKEKMHVII